MDRHVLRCRLGNVDEVRGATCPHDNFQHLFACISYYSKYTVTDFTVTEADVAKAAVMPHSLIFQSIEFLLPNREVFLSISNQY